MLRTLFAAATRADICDSVRDLYSDVVAVFLGIFPARKAEEKFVRNASPSEKAGSGSHPSREIIPIPLIENF